MARHKREYYPCAFGALRWSIREMSKDPSIPEDIRTRLTNAIRDAEQAGSDLETSSTN